MSGTLTSLFGGAMGAAIVAGVFGLIMWALNRRTSRHDKAAQQTEGLTCGLRILLYDRIKHLARAYIRRESITAEELEDLIIMHEIYHTQLGGNGFLDEVMQQVVDLPIKN